MDKYHVFQHDGWWLLARFDGTGTPTPFSYDDLGKPDCEWSLLSRGIQNPTRPDQNQQQVGFDTEQAAWDEAKKIEGGK